MAYRAKSQEAAHLDSSTQARSLAVGPTAYCSAVTNRLGKRRHGRMLADCVIEIEMLTIGGAQSHRRHGGSRKDRTDILRRGCHGRRKGHIVRSLRLCSGGPFLRKLLFSMKRVIVYSQPG